jgi:uncharacterized protein (TIRG00374 family)
VKKSTLLNLSKYLLAGGLLIFVVWSNWGTALPVAGVITPATAPPAPRNGEEPAVVGTVVAWHPQGAETDVQRVTRFKDGTLIVEDPQTHAQITFALVSKKTQLEGAETLTAGQTVAVWQHPTRGLAYVWQRHALEGQPVHWHYLLLAGVLLLGSLLLTFLRWYFLVRAQDLPFRLHDALRLGFVGYFFNTFMPGSVGGDIIKAAFLAREQNRRTVAVATVIMDRAIALWGLVLFVAMLGGVFWATGMLGEGVGAQSSKFIIKSAGIIGVVSVAVWLLLGLLPQHRAERFATRLEGVPKAGGSLAELWRAVWMYRCRQSSVLVCMLISFVGFVGFVLTFYFSALTLWDPSDAAQKIPTAAQHFLIVPIGLVINALPLFPGGAGIGELGFGALYGWLGAAVASGVLASLVQRVLTWVLGLFSYLVYLRMKRQLPARSPGDNESLVSPREGDLRPEPASA